MDINYNLIQLSVNWKKTEVKWCGCVQSRDGIYNYKEKAKTIFKWRAATSETFVFCQPGNGISYTDVTPPLRNLSKNSLHCIWTQEFQEEF